jgi:hypothetical protein
MGLRVDVRIDALVSHGVRAVDAASVRAAVERELLRTAPPGAVRPAAEAVAREVARALREAGPRGGRPS